MHILRQYFIATVNIHIRIIQYSIIPYSVRNSYSYTEFNIPLFNIHIEEWYVQEYFYFDVLIHIHTYVFNLPHFRRTSTAARNKIIGHKEDLSRKREMPNTVSGRQQGKSARLLRLMEALVDLQVTYILTPIEFAKHIVL